MKKLFFLFLLSSILIGPACDKNDNPLTNSYPKEVTVEYRATVVSGSVAKAVNISYVNATGGDTNVSDASFPFKISFKRTVNRGDYLTIGILVNNSATPGTFSIKLEILLDGKVVQSETNTSNNSMNEALVHLFI